MTKKEIERLQELEDQALSTFADKNDFNVSDWLDEKEAKEHCELYNKQFSQKDCICGQHNEWQ